MEKRDAFESEFTARQRALVEKLFDGKAMSKIYTDSILFSGRNEVDFLIHSPNMIDVNPLYADEYLNLLIDFRTLWRLDTDVELNLNDIATHLIGLIKREYHLHGEEKKKPEVKSE